MNPLLLLGGLAAAKKSMDESVHRKALGLMAYAVLVCSGLVAVGFLTAGCFMYLIDTWGAITASLVVAAVYAIAGLFGFLLIRRMQRRYSLPVVQPLSSSAANIASATASQDVPGGIISVGLLVAAGYFMGRSMVRRR